MIKNCNNTQQNSQTYRSGPNMQLWTVYGSDIRNQLDDMRRADPIMDSLIRLITSKICDNIHVWDAELQGFADFVVGKHVGLDHKRQISIIHPQLR
jgi:hypothetical protein